SVPRPTHPFPSPAPLRRHHLRGLRLRQPPQTSRSAQVHPLVAPSLPPHRHRYRLGHVPLLPVIIAVAVALASGRRIWPCSARLLKRAPSLYAAFARRSSSFRPNISC